MKVEVQFDMGRGGASLRSVVLKGLGPLCTLGRLPFGAMTVAVARGLRHLARVRPFGVDVEVELKARRGRGGE